MERTNPRANFPTEHGPVHGEERQHTQECADFGEPKNHQFPFAENQQRHGLELPQQHSHGSELGHPFRPDTLVGELKVDIFDTGLGGAILGGIGRQQRESLGPGVACAIPVTRLAGEFRVLREGFDPCACVSRPQDGQPKRPRRAGFRSSSTGWK